MFPSGGVAVLNGVSGGEASGERTECTQYLGMQAGEAQERWETKSLLYFLR